MQKNRRIIGGVLKNHALELLARELLNNGRMCPTDLCSATGLPSWKVSRLLRRAESLGLMHSTSEFRFERGRPRKYFELTPEGRRFLSGAVEGIAAKNRGRRLKHVSV